MGYLRFFAAIRGLPDTAPLHGIDRTMPWRAYGIASCELVLVEWLRRPNPNNPPPHNMVAFPKGPEFGCRPAGVAFKDGFGPAAPGLDDLYGRLSREKRAGTFSAVAVHSGLMLHRLTGRPVLSICSDDDEWDLACEIDGGRVSSLTFASGDEEVRVDREGRVSTLPSTDPRQLHRIAERAATAWCDELRGLFGFDGRADALGLRELDRVSYEPEAPQLKARDVPRQTSTPKQPFWKFW